LIGWCPRSLRKERSGSRKPAAVANKDRLNRLLARLEQSGVNRADLRDAETHIDSKQVNRPLR
jgi:hypothetical protein